MTTIISPANAGKADFEQVAASFLDQPGLPFADILSADSIEQAFAQRDALFATDATYSTPLVLWSFLAQVLSDGKDAACAAAVADIATYMQQTGGPVPSGDTGDYCRARAKLDPAVLRSLVRQSARQLDDQASDEWLWHGRHAKLVDGFTFTMPDTPDNQEAFPQQKTQAPGVGFPIARACAVLSLATAAICDLAVGPYEGKETGETALLRTMLDGFAPGEVVVFDRCFGSFLMLAMLQLRGVDVCTRLHQCRHEELCRIRQLGPGDYLVRWTRPVRPAWMSPDQYAQIPETLTLREVEFDVTEPGRTETITVITTLTDPNQYSSADLAELYGYRWNAELDIRVIKQTLGLDHARCKSPEMVERELWVMLLGYNLIRKVIATAAAVHEKQPRQIGFTLACQTILSSWMLAATGACRDVRALTNAALERIAANEVANRPGRIEPRVLKRRRHCYPLMTKPRNELRKELA
jgi:putative transposase